MVTFLVCAFGFTVNDIFDRGKDEVAGVQRPIALGIISPHVAIVAALVTGASALITACVAGPVLDVGCTLILLLCYSPVAYRWPLAKNIYAAAMCCFPFAHVALLGDRHFSPTLYLLIVSFIGGRELLMDTEERMGDERTGLYTLASRLGDATSRSLAWLLMVIATAYAASELVDNPQRLLACAALITVALIPAIPKARQVSASRLPMLLITVAVALSL